MFVLTGLALRLEDVASALSAKRAAAFGILSCLVLSPALAAPLVVHVPALLPALQAPFLAGLALVLCVPTTLSTGVILSQACGANAALTLLLVVATNVLGVFTIPYALAAVFGAAAGAALEPTAILVGLARTILAPLALGAAARCVRAAASARAAALRALTRVLSPLALTQRVRARRRARRGRHAPRVAAAAAGLPGGHALDDGTVAMLSAPCRWSL